MEVEQAEQHSRMTLSAAGAVVLRMDPHPASREAIRERDAAQAETLKEAAAAGIPFCEKCTVAR